jgi:hypothetical protein
MHTSFFFIIFRLCFALLFSAAAAFEPGLDPLPFAHNATVAARCLPWRSLLLLPSHILTDYQEAAPDARHR